MYLNDWKDGGLEGMKSDFGIDDTALAGADILLASYGYERYEGSAFVLFRRDGKLYEVNGGHCSCYGLNRQSYSAGDTETQWQPEETTLESLRYRLEKGRLGKEGHCGNEFADELRAVLAGLDNGGT
jgi:hypothetical protein